jgi:glycosyltransferase involved in cell wall biosynthesis
MLGDPHGNTVQRHIEYANRIGRLTIVTYNRAAQPKQVTRVADNFVIYPTNTHPVLFPWVATRIAARLQRRDPADVVTTQDPFATGLVGMLLKWRFGVPLDMQNHSSFLDNPVWVRERPLRNRVLRTLSELTIRQADTHRVLTEPEKAAYVRRGIAADRVAVLPTPAHVEIFAEPVGAETLATLRESLDIAPYAPVLLWIGFPAVVKNVELLLATYEHLQREWPDVQLVMVGDFSTRPQFTQRAEAAGVIFTGRVDHSDLPAYYQLADMYVHSSRYEGFGKVLVEALAAGTPVVATRGDGPQDVVRDGETGLLTDHTAEALAAAIHTLLDDPDRARTMGIAGQRDVLERFDYERQLDRIVESFRTTLRVAKE